MNACSTLSLHQQSRNRPAQTSLRTTRPALQFLPLFLQLRILRDSLLVLLQEALEALETPATPATPQPKASTSAPTCAVRLPLAQPTTRARSPLHPTSTAQLPAKLNARLTLHANRKSSPTPSFLTTNIFTVSSLEPSPQGVAQSASCSRLPLRLSLLLQADRASLSTMLGALCRSTVIVVAKSKAWESFT